MEKVKYSEKLKDPRWQKVRLQVFERDEWCCQRCFDSEATLNVHHCRYEKGKDPWEYPLNNFVTLCENCHNLEYETRGYNEKLLLTAIREKGFFSDDITFITNGINNIQSAYPSEVVATIIEYAFSEFFDVISKSYFSHLRQVEKGEDNE